MEMCSKMKIKIICMLMMILLFNMFVSAEEVPIPASGSGYESEEELDNYESEEDGEEGSSYKTEEILNKDGIDNEDEIIETVENNAEVKLEQNKDFELFIKILYIIGGLLLLLFIYLIYKRIKK